MRVCVYANQPLSLRVCPSFSNACLQSLVTSPVLPIFVLFHTLSGQSRIRQESVAVNPARANRERATQTVSSNSPFARGQGACVQRRQGRSERSEQVLSLHLPALVERKIDFHVFVVVVRHCFSKIKKGLRKQQQRKHVELKADGHGLCAEDRRAGCYGPWMSDGAGGLFGGRAACRRQVRRPNTRAGTRVAAASRPWPAGWRRLLFP